MASIYETYLGKLFSIDENGQTAHKIKVAICVAEVQEGSDRFLILRLIDKDNSLVGEAIVCRLFMKGDGQKNSFQKVNKKQAARILQKTPTIKIAPYSR